MTSTVIISLPFTLSRTIHASIPCIVAAMIRLWRMAQVGGNGGRNVSRGTMAGRIADYVASLVDYI